MTKCSMCEKISMNLEKLEISLSVKTDQLNSKKEQLEVILKRLWNLRIKKKIY
jgi:hypothetical protein